MAGDNIDHALRGYADRVLNLHNERKELNDNIREVYGEAKDAGFDTTTLREIVREMRMEPDARAARYQLLDEYRIAVGILADTPLGRASEPSSTIERPRPLAEQPVHRGRGRPRKSADQALDDARTHLGASKPMFDA
jgi:uncharacterized protein (UPF0335 family)